MSRVCNLVKTGVQTAACSRAATKVLDVDGAVHKNLNKAYHLRGEPKVVVGKEIRDLDLQPAEAIGLNLGGKFFVDFGLSFSLHTQQTWFRNEYSMITWR